MKVIAWWPLYLTISLLVLAAGIYSILRWGWQFSIGFTGGSLIEAAYQQPVTTEAVTASLEGKYRVDSVFQSGDNGQSVIIKGESIDENQFAAVQQALNSVGQYQLQRFESVGPVISGELIRKTITAVLIVSMIILGYLAWQFHELRFGVSAVIAMFHDSLVLLGIFSLLGHFAGIEVDVLFVTAMLTTLSFSVHDTIVVFHRIRELQGRFPRAPLADVLDAAVTETMSRSINNSVTIILMLLALTLLGGSTLFGFSLALLIGAVTGTYSSPFVAVPLLYLWHKLELRYRHR